MDIAALAAGFLRLGNLRYFLTGITLLTAAGLILRAFGKLLDPFACWRIFRGTCTQADGAGALAVTFTDGHRLTHTAAFRSDVPGAAEIRPGDAVTVAIRTEVFLAGSYPEALSDAEPPGRAILLRSEQRKRLRRELLRTAAVQAVICGIAVTVFLLTKQYCFP